MGELEATQFSTTTKLKGQATWVFGASHFKGSASQLRSESDKAFGATSFNYDLQLGLATSFTGKDQLTTVLRGGNFDGDGNVFGSGGPSGLATLETCVSGG